jgi:hypothetical protein
MNVVLMYVKPVMNKIHYTIRIQVHIIVACFCYQRTNPLDIEKKEWRRFQTFAYYMHKLLMTFLLLLKFTEELTKLS